MKNDSSFDLKVEKALEKGLIPQVPMKRNKRIISLTLFMLMVVAVFVFFGIIIVFLIYIFATFSQVGLKRYSPVVCFWAVVFSIFTFYLSLFPHVLLLFNIGVIYKFFIFTLKNLCCISIIIVAGISFIGYIIFGYYEAAFLILFLWIFFPVFSILFDVIFLIKTIKERFFKVPGNEYLQRIKSVITKKGKRLKFSNYSIVTVCSIAYIIILFFIFIVFFTIHSTVMSGYKIKFKPYGKLYDINANQIRSSSKNDTYGVYLESWKMHINCVGSKENLDYPTILFESVGGLTSLNFASIESILKLNGSIRSCSYDHAGFGYSQQGLMPRTITQKVAEIHQLLQKAGESGPFLIVDNGRIGRYFSYKYPNLVSGLLLLDAIPDDLEKFYGSNSAVRKLIFDLSRSFVVFGGFKIFFPEERDFLPKDRRKEFSMMLNLNEYWNQMYLDMMNAEKDNEIMRKSKIDCPKETKCLNNIPIWYVKMGYENYNKTCEELKYDPNSSDCEKQIYDNENWISFMNDFENQTNDFKQVLLLNVTKNFWEKPSETSRVLFNFYDYVIK